MMRPSMQQALAWIDTRVRRSPWLLTLLGLIPAAYFNAAAMNQFLAAKLLPSDVGALKRADPADPSAATAAGRGEANHHVRDVNAILRRDIFDADAGCLNCPPPPPPPEAENPLAADQRPPDPCEGTARVTGAVVVDDPLWSFVFVVAAQGQPAMPYRMGQILDGKSVSQIGWRRDLGAYLVLRPNAGNRCFYAQIMPPRPAAPARPAPPPPGATASAGVEGADGDMLAVLNSIERSGANEFTLRRSSVDRILENQAELMRTTRIMPVYDGGRVSGVQLFGVSNNTILGRLGMQNGDVLKTINGLDISSPDRALEAYSRLRTADRISVAVVRNGQPQTLDFNIR